MIQTKVFNVNEINDVIYLTIPAFEDTGIVNHCFSTRHGGVSDGVHATMNLGFYNGDSDVKVKENYSLLCDACGIKVDALVLSKQTHKDYVKVVSKENVGNGYSREQEWDNVDGMVTNEKDVALVTSFADCVPLFFLDPVKAVIGLSHAGWRGTVKKIGKKTIDKMIEVYGCNVEDILVAIGPSIGKCCFEVSEDVKIEVEKSYSSDIIEELIENKGHNKYMVDLWRANEVVLLESGILQEHITVSDICTMCQKDDFHSHRGTNGQRGNMVAIMSLINWKTS